MIVIEDNIPASACAIVVPGSQDNTPYCLLGAAAFGSEAELKAFEALAAAHNLKSDRITNDGKPNEAMLLFRPGTSIADAAAIFAAAKRGSFGKAELRVFIAPQAKAADGIDLDSEVVSIGVGAIVPPAE